MLDVLGSGYVIDHCISAFLDSKKRELYQQYIAECLRAMAWNTSLVLNEGGMYIEKSFEELTSGKKEESQKTGDEIADEIVNLIGR